MGRTMKRQMAVARPPQDSSPAPAGSVVWSCGPEEVHQQRYQQPPRHHAAREVQRRQARADDVAHAQVSRADGRRGDRRDAADTERIGFRAAAQSDRAPAHLTDMQEEFLAGGKQLEYAEQVHARSEAHVGEEDLGGLAAALPGLVNLGGGHRFGERQFRIVDHHAAQQGDEQNAEDAAHGHQHAGFPVGMLESRTRARLWRSRTRES